MNAGIRDLDEWETVAGDEWIDIRSGVRLTKGSLIDRGFFSAQVPTLMVHHECGCPVPTCRSVDFKPSKLTGDSIWALGAGGKIRGVDRACFVALTISEDSGEIYNLEVI